MTTHSRKAARKQPTNPSRKDARTRQRKTLGPFTEEAVAQWEPLVHRVVSAHFWWAYDNRQSRKPGIRSVVLEYDDLVSEGHFALVNAWRKFRTGRGASFKTYAYTAIRNRIQKYVDRKLFARKTLADGELVLGFGELAEELGAAAGACDDRLARLENEEWTAHCIGLLGEHLGVRAVRALLMHAAGDQFWKIGEALGTTGEWARRLVQQWMVEAMVVLRHLEEESYDK